MSEKTEKRNFVVKNFEIKDLQEVYKLFFDAVHAINSKDYTKDQINAWAPESMDSSKWEKDLSSTHTFCVWDQIKNIIVGFANLRDDGYMDKGYVHKSYQARGVGLLLLRTLESRAKDLGIKRLFADVSITARKSLEFMGYKVEKEQIVTCHGVEFMNYHMSKVL